MADAKKKADKKDSSKKYWKIMATGWAKPILKSKDETSDRYLEKMKAKGYKVEEA